MIRSSPETVEHRSRLIRGTRRQNLSGGTGDRLGPKFHFVHQRRDAIRVVSTTHPGRFELTFVFATTDLTKTANRISYDSRELVEGDATVLVAIAETQQRSQFILRGVQIHTAEGDEQARRAAAEAMTGLAAGSPNLATGDGGGAEGGGGASRRSGWSTRSTRPSPPS